MSGEVEELATTPSFVCNEDEGTWITLEGEEFSPLVIDTIARESDPDVEIPTVTITLRYDPTGDAAGDSFRTTLESPVGAEEGVVRWHDDETMEFFVDHELELPEGVYDVEVDNPNGTVVLKEEAFGVLDRPSVHTAIPEMTCVAQGARDIVIEGDNLLILGDDVATMRLDEEQVEVVDTADCRDLHAVFTEHQLCEEVTVRLEEESFEAGVYTVSAENLDPAGCKSDAEGDGVTVTVNDPPQPEAIAPTPICSEQVGYEAMEIDGRDFVVLRDDEGDEIYPTVAVGDRSYDAIAADGCEEVETAPVLGAERCTQLTIAIDAGDLADQMSADETYADLHIEVTNPDPVGCHSTDSLDLTAVPPPEVHAVVPDPICTAQYENSLEVSGRGFVAIADAEPVVHVGDETYPVDALENCTDVPTPEATTISCETLTFTVPEGDLDPERTDVVVENPETAACASTEERTVQVVPPPVVSAVAPQPLCTDQQTRTLEVEGEEFLDIDGSLPTVAIGDQEFDATELDDCDALPLDDDERQVQRCSKLFVDVEAGDLEADVHDVVVTNPEPAQCHSDEEVTVETVPPPLITSVAPRAVCTEGDTTVFDVEGEHLYEVDGEAPEILFAGNSYTTTASDCTDIDDGLRLCSQLEFSAEPDEISTDLHQLVAVNPDPVGCESDASEPVAFVDRPIIASVEPAAGCEGETMDPDMTIIGQFVRDSDGDEPTVMMDGIEVSIDDYQDCDTDSLGDMTLETCHELHVTVPESLREESFDITVAGADPVACGEDMISIEREPLPVVTSVVPKRICDEGGTLSIEGENLSPDAEYFLDGEPASDVDYHSSESVDVTFEGPLDLTEQTVTVANPGDCSTTHEEEIRVTEGPKPIFVDPPVTFDGMNTQVTIFATGLRGGSIDQVELVHPDGSATVLEHTVDDEREHIVQAVVPEGMLDDGVESDDFGIRLTDQIDDQNFCSNESFELLTITSELTVAIESIEPPFGSQEESTGVEILAAEDPGADMVNFEAVPRAYLNPTFGDDDSVAREIRSLLFFDGTELAGIVPSGLPVGTYDVIVVNPDGAIGVLDGAFEVTEEPPPLIDAVSPGSWETGTTVAVEVEGQHFRDDPDDPQVEAFCRAPGDDTTDEDQLSQPASITVDDVQEEVMQITVDTGGLDHLDVCYMRVTNPEGTFAEYSPITVTNPAGNFASFQDGTELNIERRAPTAFSGVASRTARYLYVVGGDDGNQGGAFASGEFARVDRFGSPGTWRHLPFELPSGRTLANGVRVEDFVYLVGGFDEAQGGVSDEVHRAQVLDPLDVPEIVDVDLFPEDDDPGLEEGTYYYRVAAVYGGADPANPGGESLASEPQPIRLPLDELTVTISWDPPEDINHEIESYRVYRSMEADDPYGDESLIYETADADERTFVDDGTAEPTAGAFPLPTGSLGTWHHVSTLEHGRMAAGVAVSENPDDSEQHFIYVIGGEDNDSDYRDDYEFITVDVDGPRVQQVSDNATVGEVEPGVDNTLVGPRADLEAVVAHSGNASSLSGVPPQVFVVGGDSEGIDSDSDVYVASVNADGHLDEWTQLPVNQRINPERRGHAAAALNNNIVLAGGDDGNTEDSVFDAEIECDAGCPPAALDSSASSQGGAGMRPRSFMGHVTFRGFWYLTGGLDGTGEPTSTVDYSPAGGTP